jgi:uncharacterized protein (DUF2132 family)
MPSGIWYVSHAAQRAMPRPDPPRRPTLSPSAMTPAPDHTNPMHGVTLEMMLNELVAHYGWNAMGQTIAIRCFTTDPSVASSLKFLRRTPWARAKVEALYRDLLRVRARQTAG